MMTGIPVLHLMNAFADASISRIVHRIIEHNGTRDFDWHVGALRGVGDMQKEFELVGAQVVEFSNRTGKTLDGKQSIRDYVALNKIRIVHTHSPRTVLNAAAAIAGLHNVRHVGTKHLLNKCQDRRWGRLYVFLDRLSLLFPDRIVAVSELMYREILSQPGIRRNRVTLIRNCIPCDHFYAPMERDACRSELDLPANSPVIGYAGRIQQVKRLDVLIQAFSQVLENCPQARLLIVGGEGYLQPELAGLARSLGISRAVIWTGFRKDIPRLLAAMDIYVQPSSNEGLSLSILEAMAANKPVIATDVGGVRETIKDGETGILVPPNSPSAISKAVIHLLTSPGERLRMACRGQEFVVGNFGIAAMVKAYRHLYETLAS